MNRQARHLLTALRGCRSTLSLADEPGGPAAVCRFISRPSEASPSTLFGAPGVTRGDNGSRLWEPAEMDQPAGGTAREAPLVALEVAAVWMIAPTRPVANPARSTSLEASAWRCPRGVIGCNCGAEYCKERNGQGTQARSTSLAGAG